MAQEKLVCNPFLHVVKDFVVAVKALGEVESNGVYLRSCIVHKEVDLGEGVEIWAHYSFGCPW
jgi:hypothetical protein